MRDFRDQEGRIWQALPVQSTVAHGRNGAALGFRPADDGEAEPLLSTVTFNSVEAAETAISTLGEKELNRRLGIARQVLGR